MENKLKKLFGILDELGVNILEYSDDESLDSRVKTHNIVYFLSIFNSNLEYDFAPSDFYGMYSKHLNMEVTTILDYLEDHNLIYSGPFSRLDMFSKSRVNELLKYINNNKSMLKLLVKCKYTIDKNLKLTKEEYVDLLTDYFTSINNYQSDLKIKEAIDILFKFQLI